MATRGSYRRSKPTEVAVHSKPRPPPSTDSLPSSSVAGVTDLNTSSSAFSSGTSNVESELKNASHKFATDSEISFGRYEQSGPGRRLKAFSDFGPTEKNGSRVAGTFGDDEFAKGGDRWDQFEDNKRLFGVTSTYDEHYYTTKINTSAPNFAERMAEAERLAAEIEGCESSNPHIREERGLASRAGDGDEEDRFSGVSRSGLERKAPPATGPVQKLSYAAAASSGRTRSAPPSRMDDPPSRPPRSPRSEGMLAQSSAVPAASLAMDPGVTSASASKQAEESQAQTGNPSVSLTNSRRSRENLSQFERQSISGRASPTQTRNSPLVKPTTPSVQSTAAIRSLSLEVQPPGLGPEAVKQFEHFKMEQELRSVVEERGKITEELKKFSSHLPVNRARQATKNDKIDSPPVSLSPKARDFGSRSLPSGDGVLRARLDVPATESVDTQVSGPGNAPSDLEMDEKSTGNEPFADLPKSKRISKAFKFNPDAPAFNLNPDAPVFQPSPPPVPILSVSNGLEYAPQFPAPSLPGPMGQDMGPYLYMPDASALAVPHGAPTGFPPGQYRPTSIPGYSVPSQGMPPNVGPSMMHPGQFHMGYSSMSRTPYNMPYQSGLGPGAQARSFGPSTQPYGLPVPGSVMPGQGPGSSPYVPGNSYPYAATQPGMQPPPVAPSMIPVSPQYYSPGGPVGGRGGGVNRTRRGGRGAHHRQSHGNIHHGHASPGPIPPQIESAHAHDMSTDNGAEPASSTYGHPVQK